MSWSSEDRPPLRFGVPVNAYLAATHNDSFRFFAGREDVDEVNFSHRKRVAEDPVAQAGLQGPAHHEIDCNVQPPGDLVLEGDEGQEIRSVRERGQHGVLGVDPESPIPSR